MYKLLLVSDKAEVRALYEGFAEWENLGFERPAVAASAQEGIELFALYHPASLIYNRSLEPVYEADVRALAQALRARA